MIIFDYDGVSWPVSKNFFKKIDFNGLKSDYKANSRIQLNPFLSIIMDYNGLLRMIIYFIAL